MSCDFSKRESTEYITQFMGDNPWLIDVNVKTKYFNHINHAQRINKNISERKFWLNGKGLYPTFKIKDGFLIAEKSDMSLTSRIKLNLKTGHLYESFAIKRSSFGNAMDWNHEYANADCTVIKKDNSFNIQ